MLKIKEFHSELNAFEVYNLFKNQKNSIEFMIFETMQSKSYIDGKEVKGDPFNSLEDFNKININII